MPAYSKHSKSILLTCDRRIQLIFNEVIKVFDNKILHGYRGMAEQNRLFDIGASQVRYPNSRHNVTPSMAVDAAPWPIDWDNLNRFRFFNGYVLGVARTLRIPLRCGCDWDNDTFLKDNKFNDLCHYEIIGD